MKCGSGRIGQMFCMVGVFGSACGEGGQMMFLWRRGRLDKEVGFEPPTLSLPQQIGHCLRVLGI